jgi:uncharacterized protein (DUF2235 family)
MPAKQRLVVCLDGTWNKKDDSTNVIHHFALAVERPWPDASGKCRQTRYYGEGVGTGVLDRISGGGFGFGLESKVRAAYDWLVEHYHDGDNPDDADEIYIFGFSRGAYTARSLVGFIGTFGLLRPGAPLPVNQLWNEYCLLGRKRDGRTSFWDKVFGEDFVNIRRISNLILDPWNIEKFGERRENNGGQASGNRVPGQLVGDLNKAERLLVRWSRRVRIKYLGLYDTVGAMGIDALAIPGLKSKLAMHHNLRPTTLIQKCRHALALDEHRSSFNHTPLTQFIGHGDDEEDNQRKAMTDEEAAAYWAQRKADWVEKIEQRWFAGAHSNIGGGYPDNELAQLPLAWLLEGAKKAELECSDITFSLPTSMPKPRDSYSEFAKPFWSKIIRGKRFYRQLDPKPEVRAGVRKGKDKKKRLWGHSLESINEQFDDNLLRWAAAGKEYQPPNLWEYAKRKLKAEPACDQAPLFKEIVAKKPHHHWLGEAWNSYLFVALWATFAAAGLAAMNELFTARQTLPSLLLLATAAFAFPIVDWGESRANFWLAAGGSKAWRRAFYDSILWLRLLGFGLFVFGSITALVRLCGMGWYAESFSSAWGRFTEVLGFWWPVPVAAGVAVALANALECASAKRQAAGLRGGLVLGFVSAAGISLLFIMLARVAGYVFTPAFGQPHMTGICPAEQAAFAGWLILLQLGFAYLLDAFRWVGEPMTRANLGSILPLQFCITPRAVVKRLQKWQIMLTCRWSKDDKDMQNGPAAIALRETLRQAIWRDIFGFIFIYGSVMAFGLWFGAQHLGWQWLNREYLYLPLWGLLPLAAALSDWIEDACHLHYLRLHQNRVFRRPVSRRLGHRSGNSQSHGTGATNGLARNRRAAGISWCSPCGFSNLGGRSGISHPHEPQATGTAHSRCGLNGRTRFGLSRSRREY